MPIGTDSIEIQAEIHRVTGRTSDEIVDLTRGDFDLAIRYGTGRYPGLDVELLLKNEVFPACSPRLHRPRLSLRRRAAHARTRLSAVCWIVTPARIAA